MMGRPDSGRVAAALMLAALTIACESTSPADPPPDEIEAGTWGGEDAGLIVNDSVAHVHIGCTLGNFPAPIALDAGLRFDVAGEYLLRAYPVAQGPMMPARLSGVLRGDVLILSVAVHDTIENQLVVRGPVTVRRGREPKLGLCPICRSPGLGWSAFQAPRTRPGNQPHQPAREALAPAAGFAGHPALPK